MRKYILNMPLDDFCLKDIEDKVINKERIFHVFANVRKVNLFYKNDDLKQILSDRNCIFSVDGKWVKWVANIKGFFPKERFGGLEVINSFFSRAEESRFRIYLLGAKREILDKAQDVLNKRFPKVNIVGSRDGFFSVDEELNLINDIKEKNPDIVFLALPSPRKELLGYRIFKEVDSLKYVAGVGGAFDLIAGETKRAPVWVQQIGLEWFYRCLQEPKRLFKRYFKDGIYFLQIIVNEIVGRSNYNEFKPF